MSTFVIPAESLHPGLGCERDVVVHELSPGHEHHCHSVVMEPVILVDSGGHGPGVGKREPGGGHPGRGDAVSVVRGQEPAVGDHGGAPVRLGQVVTNTLDAAIPELFL